MIKSPMPKEPTHITVPLRLKLVHDFSRFSTGGLIMKIGDTATVFTDKESGEKVGEMGAGLSGRVYVEIGKDVCYAVGQEAILEFFKAAQEAHEKSLEESDVRPDKSGDASSD